MHEKNEKLRRKFWEKVEVIEGLNGHSTNYLIFMSEIHGK